MAAIFVDTSAIYAALVAEDSSHGAARSAFEQVQRERLTLVSSSLILQECVALLQAKVGVGAVRLLHETVTPLLDIVWVERTLYQRAMAALLASAAKAVSLTDWSSFEIMRELEIDRALTFDRHFREQGFRVLPER